MAPRPRAHLATVQPCPHGSLPLREIGAAGREILDFSASCNPLGTSPEVRAALRVLDLAPYPDDQALALRHALATRLRVDPDWVAVGNGSVDLMWQLATAYLDPGDRALVVGPTFGEYARACRVVGGAVEEVRAREEEAFQLDLGRVRDALLSTRPRLAFLCNPNNPTGGLLPASAVEALLEACEDTLLVVDEAYRAFCEDPPDLLPLVGSGRLLLLRSMTKDHGLAGLRLGYAVARPEVVESLNRVRPPWAVSSPAQAAGLAALRNPGHVEAGRAIVREARDFLVERLSALGLSVLPSAANFLLVRVGDGAALRAALLERGVCVRDCASFGLPEHVRIGLRTLPECRRLVDALREVLAGG